MLLCNWFCCAESQTNLLSAKQTQNLFCCLANPSPYFEEVDVAVQGQTKFDPFTLCHDCLQWKLRAIFIASNFQLLLGFLVLLWSKMVSIWRCEHLQMRASKHNQIYTAYKVWKVQICYASWCSRIGFCFACFWVLTNVVWLRQTSCLNLGGIRPQYAKHNNKLGIVCLYFC